MIKTDAIKISLVEDHAGFRNILLGLLQSQQAFVVTDIFADAETALKGLPLNPPDIAIIDIQLPGMNGIELIRACKLLVPATQILICTSHHDDKSVFDALANGALGYLLKDASGDEIIKAIAELHNGGAPMSPYIARKVIKHIHSVPERSDQFDITKREHEVLVLLSKGLQYKELADMMNVSNETIKKHIRNIYRKLHVQNKVEALNKYRL
jgi:DNA-binding NarL/FixJ family response regulator